MAEYIEREASLILGYWHGERPTIDNPSPNGVDAVDSVDIEAIPAADVAPVRHGRWIKTIGENGVTSACRCNLCGFEDNRYSLFSYCPNCGASMEVSE